MKASGKTYWIVMVVWVGLGVRGLDATTRVVPDERASAHRVDDWTLDRWPGNLEHRVREADYNGGILSLGYGA